MILIRLFLHEFDIYHFELLQWCNGSHAHIECLTSLVQSQVQTKDY